MQMMMMKYWLENGGEALMKHWRADLLFPFVVSGCGWSVVVAATPLIKNEGHTGRVDRL